MSLVIDASPISPPRRWLVVLASMALGLVPACQRGVEETRTTESGGVEIVENFGDGAWAGRPDALRLALEQVYGVDQTPEQAILSATLRAAGTEEGDVYVQDARRGQLLRFRADGSLAWTAGRPGRGPGEFYAVTGLALSPDRGTVIVSSVQGTRLDFWSSGGEFLDSVTLDPDRGLPGALGGFVGDHLLLYGSLPRRIGARVVLVKPDDLQTRSSFEIDVTSQATPGPGLEDIDSFGGRVPVRSFSGLIASGSRASYEVRFYTMEGELVRRVTRDVPYPVRSGHFREGGRGARHDFGVLDAPIPLPGGHFLVDVSWEEGIIDPDAAAAERRLSPDWDPDKWRVTFDIFDRDGRLVQSVTPPGKLEVRGRYAYAEEIGRLVHSVGTGPGEIPYLYTICVDPFPQIRRYRIEFEPPAPG